MPMLRFVPILALALAAGVTPVDVAFAKSQTAQARDNAPSPRALERRARHAPPEQKAELLRMAAQRWIARGDRQRAIAALDGAIGAKRDDARLWLRRGELHAATGAPWKAIDDVTRAIDLDAARPAAFRTRALLWRRVGARDMAAADLTVAGQLEQRIAAARSAPAVSEPADATDGATLAALEPPRRLVPTGGATVTQVARREIDPGALDALTMSVAMASAPPRSLLPAGEPLAANGTSGDEVAIAAQPARSALLEHPALDGITMAAARLQASPGPAPTHSASTQPMFPPPAPNSGIPPAPDPIEAHRRRMEAAAIVQRRIEAGEAMMAAMRASPAGGLPDPSFRASTAPLPKIYRGTQIPAQLAAKAGVAKPATPTAGVGGPYLPVRKALPAARQAKLAAAPASTPMVAALPRVVAPAPVAAESFDATPADPMIEHGVAAPVISVERGALQ